MTDYFKLDADRETLLNLSSLGLAHLGDSVFEVMVRSWLCLHGKAKVKDLHRATVKYVAAPAQAKRYERIAAVLPRRNRTYSAGAETPPPTPSPKPPPGGSIRPPPVWKLCSAGCISRAGPSGSTNCSS